MTGPERRPDVELSGETRNMLASVHAAFDWNQLNHDAAADWCCYGCAVSALFHYLGGLPALEREQGEAEHWRWVEQRRRSLR